MTVVEQAQSDEADNSNDAEPVDDLAATETTAAPPEASGSRRGPVTALHILAGAILVAVIVQIVFTWLTLGVTTQVRDQSAVANGLQRCLIQAQLAENTTTDPSGTAYRSAVQSCLSK